MLQTLVAWWAVSEIQPTNPDVIAPSSYGLSQAEQLAKGTTAGIKKVCTYAREFPQSVIVFGNCLHSFGDSPSEERRSELVERSAKNQLLLNEGIPEERIIIGGGIRSTVQEIRVVAEALRERAIKPEEILLLCEKTHSRSVLWIAERIFPEAFPGVKISLKYTRTTGCQSNSIFPLQRSRWKWLAANVARQSLLTVAYFFFGTKGMEMVGNVKHKPHK